MKEQAKKIKSKLKRGDNVVVIAGKDLGKEGKVLQVSLKDGRVIVEGINMMTKHQKPSRSNQTGGIVHREAPIDASNIMYLHKNKPTRLGYKIEVTEVNGKKEVTKKRFAKSTGEVIE